MAFFNTTIIISGVHLLVLMSDNPGTDDITATNDKYGLLYSKWNGNVINYPVLQAVQNNLLIGKFKYGKFSCRDECCINLFNKQNKSNIIGFLYACPGDIGCSATETNCLITKSIFTEIRQKKMQNKIYKMSYKMNLLKKRLDRLTNKTL